MNIKYTIPESLDEINLKTYIQAINLLSNSDDEHELVVKIKLASIITGLELQDLAKIPIANLNELFDHFMKIIEEKPKFKPIVKVNGVEYGFIPDMENLMTNEYLDLTLYFGSDILKTTAILYRPVEKKVKNLYTIQKYKGLKDIDIYNEFPASVYVSCMLFFWNLQNDLLKTIPQYLIQKMTKEQQATLEANGVGMSQLTKLLEEIDLNMTESQMN